MQTILATLDRRPPGRKSRVADDHSPLEFSVALCGGAADLRVLFEPQASEASVEAFRTAALGFHDRLKAPPFNAELVLWEQLHDLFAPSDHRGQFIAWNAAVFTERGATRWKTYLDPTANGVERAAETIDVALDRLGLSDAWWRTAYTALARGPYLDEVTYFAIDLEDPATARIKVYVQHHSARAADLDDACAAAGNYRPGQVADFVQALGGSSGPLQTRAPVSCHAFVQGRAQAEVTVYVPAGSYAASDSEVADRVRRHLRDQPADLEKYGRVLEGFGRETLERSVGLQSWVAFRMNDDRPRTTVYLSPQVREEAPTFAPPKTEPRVQLPSARPIIERLRRLSLACHPFIARLKRLRDNEAIVWDMVVNLYNGTSRHFIGWLAHITANVRDDRQRSLLARQLSEELGDGDFDKAHSVMMRSFLRGIDPLRPRGPTSTAIGERLGQELAKFYASSNPEEALAALMLGEIAANQLIFVVGELLEPHRGKIDPSMTQWLTRHNELEGDHADESLVLADLIPNDPAYIASVERGAIGVHSALWKALDALLVKHFGSDSPDRREPVVPAHERGEARPSARRRPASAA